MPNFRVWYEAGWAQETRVGGHTGFQVIPGVNERDAAEQLRAKLVYQHGRDPKSFRITKVTEDRDA